MRITFLREVPSPLRVGGVALVYQPGQTAEVEDKLARAWILGGAAKPADGSSAPPAPQNPPPQS